jgi:hypothetical protein
VPITIKAAYVARSLRTGRPLLPVRVTVHRGLGVAFAFAPHHLNVDRATFIGDDFAAPGRPIPLTAGATMRHLAFHPHRSGYRCVALDCPELAR